MEHFEMVEKLRNHANVTYEEAKNALEKSNWDMLDALILLESEGKIRKENADSYTTQKPPEPKKEPEQDLRGTLTKVFAYLGEVFNKANNIYMDIHRHDKLLTSLPLTVLALLLIFMFWWVMPAMVISLFFGCRYSFRGHKAANSVNKAMDKAAQAAESIKTSINKDEDKD
ncbi:MAG: ubiquitin [Bacillota bacterium]|nr:ubiquitin [Bacillota bacterium]